MEQRDAYRLLEVLGLGREEFVDLFFERGDEGSDDVNHSGDEALGSAAPGQRGRAF